MTKNYLQYAVSAAFFLVSGMGNFALAVDEIDVPPNDTLATAQRLSVDSSRTIQVQGIVGVISTATPVKADVDFYSFRGRAGDVVRIDIDHGSKTAGSSRSLDSLIAIFHPDGSVIDQKNDVLSSQVDEGSLTRFDPHLENIRLPVTGIYTVGVTSDGRYPDRTLRMFLPNGGTTPFIANSVSNGSYTLIIEGVSPSAIQISIDIKPGLDRIVPNINPKSKGKVPVALLSSKDEAGAGTFDPLKADQSSIRFGPSGTEASGHCNRGPDVNRDGLPDLLCHFDNEDAGFESDDTSGMVTGTIDGMQFEGRGWLKVIPVRKD